MIDLDDTDIKLLQILSKNGRISGVELSEMLSISSSTVARKIKRLEEAGVIKGYVSIIDNETIGNMCRAVLNVKLTGAIEISKVIEELLKNEHICNIYETMGNYDVMLTCCGESEESIYDILKAIRSMEGVMYVDFTSIVARRKVLKKVLE